MGAEVVQAQRDRSGLLHPLLCPAGGGQGPSTRGFFRDLKPAGASRSLLVEDHSEEGKCEGFGGCRASPGCSSGQDYSHLHCGPGEISLGWPSIRQGWPHPLALPSGRPLLLWEGRAGMTRGGLGAVPLSLHQPLRDPAQPSAAPDSMWLKC